MSARSLRLYHRLQLAAHLMQKSADRSLRETVGLTTAQAAVLSVLTQQGEASQRDIAGALGLSEASITPMTRRLLELGLIVRRQNPEDGRAWIIQLTATGANASQMARGSLSSVNRTFDNALSEAEATALANGLNKLIAAIDGAS
jgi:MarR family transcriptional regulator, organic hydroperoxide resistance regulator